MAARIVDLDPRDHDARLALRAQLRRTRTELGLSQRELGDLLGLGQGGIGRMESHGVDQSKTATVARWARALGLRLTLTPVGFPPPARWRRQDGDTDTVGALLSALVDTHNVAAFGGADGWLAARTLNDLVGIRVACGISPDRLARVQGISEQSVSLTERGTADNQLVSLQRYARALSRASRHRDGYLAVDLEPLISV